MEVRAADRSREADALLVALAAEAHQADVTPAGIEVRLACAVLDPLALEPLLGRMARLAAALRGGAAAGPYR